MTEVLQRSHSDMSDVRPEVGDSAAIAVARSEVSDLEAGLAAKRKDARRHTLWLLLGMSPGAFLPMLAALSRAGASAAMAVLLTAFVVEGWRALSARRDAKAIEIELLEARTRLDELED